MEKTSSNPPSKTNGRKNLENYQQQNNNNNEEISEQEIEQDNSQSEDFKLPIVSKKFFIIDDQVACFKNYCIGSGSFGKVLYGMSVDRKIEFGIKFEKANIKNSVIYEELKIYGDLKGGEGIPNIYWSGDYKNYKVFIMDLLGPSLDKFYKISNKLNLQTTIHFGEQMVNRLEYLHSKSYIHRDVKPNNFLLGKYNRKFDDDRVYVIDFGLSKKYIDERTKKHYDYNECSKFVGTPRYASINTHKGIRQSRRDDLESVAYILIYFLNGELPWQGIRAKTKSEKKEKIKDSKINFDIQMQCVNKELIPQELMSFLEYTKSLEFAEKPDYNYIRSLFEKIKKKNGYDKFDRSRNMWEWNEEFLGVKKNEKNDKNFNLANFSHYEKVYRKLYDGYPIPEFDEFLEILEKMDYAKNNNNKLSNPINNPITNLRKKNLSMISSSNQNANDLNNLNNNDNENVNVNVNNNKINMNNGNGKENEMNMNMTMQNSNFNDFSVNKDGKIIVLEKSYDK